MGLGNSFIAQILTLLLISRTILGAGDTVVNSTEDKQ